MKCKQPLLLYLFIACAILPFTMAATAQTATTPVPATPTAATPAPATQAAPQNITGTWEGLYGMGKYYNGGGRGLNYHWGKDSFFLHMELHQSDRKVVGFFYYASIRHPDRPIIMYQISGLLDKKNPFAFFRLAMDGIMEDNTSSRLAERLFRYMEANYARSDGSDALYGNWYPERGTGGVYWVKRVSASVGPRLQSIVDKK